MPFKIVRNDITKMNTEAIVNTANDHAADEIHAFLLENEMLIYLVVFDSQSTRLGEKLYSDLETYIDRNYVEEKQAEEYDVPRVSISVAGQSIRRNIEERKQEKSRVKVADLLPKKKARRPATEPDRAFACQEEPYLAFEEVHESKLEERMSHLSDTFSQYLLYLIQDKHMKNAEVYKRAIVDKKIFSKIKNNPDYHPQKRTALCLCVGAKLNLDETKDLLARAGYALSPCDKTDIIFSYFIENEIYDMIELDIQLEEHGLPCIIS